MSSPPFYRYFQSSRDGNPAGIQRAELHLKKLYNNPHARVGHNEG